MPVDLTRRSALSALGASALALTLAACSGSDSDGGSTAEVDPSAAASAAAAGGELLVWSWEPTLTDVVAEYQRAFPNVKVELVNAGTNVEEYTALQNAISAGSGVPDVAQIEYYALPQFSLSESLADLTQFGAADLAGSYSAGPWASVASDEGIFGLPMDSGPMALFYNEEVFNAAGVEVPTTWEEYLDAARAIHAANPKQYIANDIGDAVKTLSLLWQAGSRPYTVDGTTVGIDFSEETSQKYAELWTTLIEEELLYPCADWSDEWYRGLGDGTIASLVMGAWMPASFVGGVEAGAGKWRVAPLPAWEAGQTASSEMGGSSLAVTAASDKQALAYHFIEYANAGDGVASRIANGAFPATTADLSSEEFLGTEFEYFGGQKANEVFADSAAAVTEGWSFLPFQAYANSIFNDSVGKAYESKGATSIGDGLSAWQQACITYGNQQGFTVS